jgi:hypothetical protein
MADGTPLGIALQFLEDFGLFSVVLPFIFVFAIVFAILEKTMILGSEGKKDDPKPKASIDAMVSFVIALFVVAATNIVGIIRESLPMVVLVLIVIISFMLLAGSFMGSGEFSFSDEKNKFWRILLTVIMFFSVILIFLNAIKTENGVSWLKYAWMYMTQNWATGPIVSGLVFLVVIVGAIYFIVGPHENKVGEP